jgi:hypothetical protein
MNKKIIFILLLTFLTVFVTVQLAISCYAVYLANLALNQRFNRYDFLSSAYIIGVFCFFTSSILSGVVHGFRLNKKIEKPISIMKQALLTLTLVTGFYIILSHISELNRSGHVSYNLNEYVTKVVSVAGEYWIIGIITIFVSYYLTKLITKPRKN